MSGKPIYVLDATPVIHLARAGRLELVTTISDAVLAEEVYRETASGDYPDAQLVKDLVDAGRLRVYKETDRGMVEAFLRHPGIHLGEAETLAAAKALSGLAVMDDAESRAVAKVYGVDEAPGTLFLLFKLLSMKAVDVGEAERILGQMVNDGLYLDPRTLLKAKEKLREHKE